MLRVPAVSALLMIALAACAPTTEVESPADPPGIEKKEEEKQSGKSSKGEGAADLDAEVEIESE